MKKTWQWTRFTDKYSRKSDLCTWLDRWEALLGGITRIKIAIDPDGSPVVFYKYHRGISPDEVPSEQDEKEARYT